eukprot:comp12642_c0_seq1/m.7698 comp12642_c0_seq1/g.7698  ORF comp12642_c0_seq1/g.7698 comp12642_c0_seq1/m.7698 type:complete len:100 (-) comp12642_c0_seq1:870-1169(-)
MAGAGACKGAKEIQGVDSAVNVEETGGYVVAFCCVCGVGGCGGGRDEDWGRQGAGGEGEAVGGKGRGIAIPTKKDLQRTKVEPVAAVIAFFLFSFFPFF